jgi:hypothetical protein
MNGIEDIAHRLSNERVIGDLWVDGSFMTTKVDPVDADLVLRIQASFFDAATPQQRTVIDWARTNLKGSHRCDSYMFTEWPPGHSNYWLGEYMHAYWLRQYGFSRGQALKGIAVIELRGTAP